MYALAIYERFWAQLKALESKSNTLVWANPTPKEKREIFNLLLTEFLLYKDGKIEIRLKLPYTETQVVEAINTLSHNEHSFC